MREKGTKDPGDKLKTNSKMGDFNAATSVMRANTNGPTLHRPLGAVSHDFLAPETELVQQDVLSGKYTLDFKHLSVGRGWGEDHTTPVGKDVKQLERLCTVVGM